eukprot:16011206-Heterocapsa_arctica.AAC.1
MLLPESAAVRVLVESLSELHHWPAHSTSHLGSTLLRGKTNPTGSPRELSLNICLLGISDLNG